MLTLKTLAANAMVKDKIKFFENLSDKQASIITLHSGFQNTPKIPYFRICSNSG